MKHGRLLACAGIISAFALVAGCTSSSGDTGAHQAATPSPTATSTKPAVQHVDVVAVGDIACDPTSPVFNSPGYCQQAKVGQLTHRLVRQGAKYFLPLGDLQYEEGSLEAFHQVYDKDFGDLKSITEPVPGNHEYYTPGASGYFQYFGKRAGTPQKPWRSFSPLPGWRVFLLDSNCSYIGGCGPQSAQGRWFAHALKRSPEPCAIATWHHPMYTSGGYEGDETTMDLVRPLWKVADAGGVDIVLNGHDHIYDRFAPIGGMTEFVVGTGGKEPYVIKKVAPKSQQQFDNHIGVLRLTLGTNEKFRYAFINADNDKVLDAGTQKCLNDPKK